jgi:23S rRNA pseudouridine1911/1915/1917 synthase
MNDEEEDLEISQDQEEESGLYEHHRILVDPGQSLMRLDKFLSVRLPNTSRTKVQMGIESGLITVNGKPSKANYQIKPRDEVSVSLPHPPRNEELIPQDLPLNIVYEDEYLMVVNKPAGMVVHPAHGNWDGTLVNGLLFYINIGLPVGKEPQRPGLVHRIDKDTSGLLVIAKEEVAMMKLAKQFFDHTVERTYYALVWGQPKPADGTISQRLARSPKDRRITEVTQKEEAGKHAITHYKTLEAFSYTSLLQLNLETGRTHQIRAHMKWLGHPLFSDEAYGGKSILKGPSFSKYKSFVENAFGICPRQALHAKSLGFTHPATGKWMQFDSELPPDMAAVIDKWRKYEPSVG